MQEERREFLAGLPPDTREYRYSGFQRLEEALRQDDRPFVIVTNISKEAVDEYQHKFPGKIDYSPVLQVLVLKMASYPHEHAADAFGVFVGVKARDMSISRTLGLRGATRTDTPNRNKAADRSWAPRPLPAGRSDQWPTVALEVAWSESREKVKRDLGWWLHQSAGDVLLGISIDIKRTTGNIYVTSWERGAIPTRHHPNPDPRIVQEIKIYRGQNGQPPCLTGDDLVIPFHKMMLRSPGQGEGDFVFTKEELLELAEGVWHAMGNI